MLHVCSLVIGGEVNKSSLSVIKPTSFMHARKATKYLIRVPTHPEKRGKKTNTFPGAGNVLKFKKIRKCPGKNIVCGKKIHLEF